VCYGHLLKPMALTSMLGVSVPPLRPLWVENWVDICRCPESVQAGAASCRALPSGSTDVRPDWHARTVAGTQAVYYRDARGAEPVDEFVQALPSKRAAKIDDFVQEHLNGQPPEAPPPPFPVTSQIEGELRELRVRFANTRYRILTSGRRT
jgi:hypothetical protein